MRDSGFLNCQAAGERYFSRIGLPKAEYGQSLSGRLIWGRAWRISLHLSQSGQLAAAFNHAA